MDIPVQNIYYLLSYAWNKLDEGNIVEVDKIDTTKLYNLFASVLASGTLYLLKKGLYREYSNFSDDLKGIRGKLQLTNSLSRQLFRYGKAHCSFDELSYNIIFNQILKTTIYNLLLLKELDINIKDRLYLINDYLYEIENIELSSRLFSSLTFHRNNNYYSFLLNICQFIYENIFINENYGSSKFRDFVRDEKRMAHLFEEFIRNFYKLNLLNAKVQREYYEWDVDEKAKSIFPRMITDVSIIYPNKKIIIETKFYKNVLQTNYNKESIKADNLYQIYAYLKRAEKDLSSNQELEAILLYPTVNDDYKFDTTLDGHNFKMRTINLNQEWSQIHKDLMNLI